MKRILSIGVVVAATGYAGSTLANDLSYDYLQIGYITSDADGIDVDGAALGGSAKLNDNVFVTAGYSRERSDRVAGVRAEGDTYNLGLGYRYGLNQQTDLVVGASWVRGEIKLNSSFGSASASDNGYLLNAGLRHLLTPQLELGAVVGYSDIFDDDDTSLGLSALYHATQSLSIGLGYSVASDVDGWAVGVRLNF